MSTRRVVASSHSVGLQDAGSPTNLIGNPICAINSAQLPRIYGSGWTRKNINRLREYYIVVAEEEKIKRYSEMYRNYAKNRRKPLATSSIEKYETVWTQPKNQSNNLAKKTSTSLASSDARLSTPTKVSFNKKKQMHRELPELGESFSLERGRELLLPPQEKKKAQSSISHIAATEHSPEKTSNTYNPERYMRLTMFSRLAKRLAKRHKTQPYESVSPKFYYKNSLAMPCKENLPELIGNYVPMDIGFDLQYVMDSETFRILETVDTVYLGETEESKPHGYGVLYRKKSIYEGIFHHGHKKKGVEKYADGIYRGDYRNGKREGVGRFEWNNGEVYEGFWKNGMKHGYGLWKDRKGNSYEGDWKDNCQTGFGRFTYKGNVYAGEFVNFLKEGKGYEWFINGDHYKGEYKHGKPHGTGSYTWNDGRCATGTFIDGFHSYFTNIEYKEKPPKPTELLYKQRLNHAKFFRR